LSRFWGKVKGRLDLFVFGFEMGWSTGVRILENP